MPVTSRFRLKFKRNARQRIRSGIKHLNYVLTYDENHPDMELFDTPTRNAAIAVIASLEASLLLKVLA